MARYFAFLGRNVEVQYRAGDIVLPASGTLVADSGRSVFLEQNFEQRGQHKHFRWEIPYQCLVRMAEKPDPSVPVGDAAAEKTMDASAGPAETRPVEEPLSAAAGASAAGAPGLMPLSPGPKTA